MNITVTEENGGYVAQEDVFGFDGDGNTPDEAKKDLLEVLEDVAFFASQDKEIEKLNKLIKDITELVR
jgi:predicted RNase H-like HicB family nuclease